MTLYSYENVIASRWNGVYAGATIAIRTITKIREIAKAYTAIWGCDYVLLYTSPSLGALNKNIIMSVDGFIIPALPDMFSLCGIKNIGKSLSYWKEQLNTVFTLISKEKRKFFPKNPVKFLEYTIYNAKKATSRNVGPYGLAQAHYNYFLKIPDAIKENIPIQLRHTLSNEDIKEPIGHSSVMHTHNTFPSTAQKYRVPIWEIPNCNLDNEDKGIVTGNKQKYYDVRERYIEFAKDFLKRIEKIKE